MIFGCSARAPSSSHCSWSISGRGKNRHSTSTLSALLCLSKSFGIFESDSIFVFLFELVPVPAAELADSASAVLLQRFEFFFRFSSDRELVFSLDPFFPTGEDFHASHPPFESNFLVVFGGGLGGPELDTIIQSEQGL